MPDSSRLNGAIADRLKNERLISVGLLANIASTHTGMRVTPQMINNYEKHGLLQHANRTKGGFRQFTVEDIYTVACIKKWQSQGYSLTEIKDKLQECPEDEHLKESIPELPEDRRTQILRAAAAIFPQKGFENTTLQDVAEEAGISSSLIYQYFSGKEDLYQAFVESILFVNLKNATNVPPLITSQANYAEVRQTLIKWGTLYLSELSANAAYLRMLIASVPKFPSFNSLQMRSFVVPTESHIAQYFDHLVEQGLFRAVNCQHAMRMFVGIWVNIFMLRDLTLSLQEGELPTDQDIADLVDLFLRSVLKNPPP